MIAIRSPQRRVWTWADAEVCSEGGGAKQGQSSPGGLKMFGIKQNFLYGSNSWMCGGESYWFKDSDSSTAVKLTFLFLRLFIVSRGWILMNLWSSDFHSVPPSSSPFQLANEISPHPPDGGLRNLVCSRSSHVKPTDLGASYHHCELMFAFSTKWFGSILEVQYTITRVVCVNQRWGDKSLVFIKVPTWSKATSEEHGWNCCIYRRLVLSHHVLWCFVQNWNQQ